MGTRRFDYAEIVRLSGLMSAAEVAARVGCVKRTVERARHELKVCGPAPVNSGVPVSEERLAKAREMFADGASVSEVCRSLRMSEKTVRKYFPGAGWDRVTSARFARSVRVARERGVVL